MSIFLIGAGATADLFQEGLSAAMGLSQGPDGDWPPTMDSELRFYAALFVGFGGLCLFTARDLDARHHWTPWLALAFFGGGVGRLASWAALGPPALLFRGLMVIELFLPAVMLGLWLSLRPRRAR